MIHEEICTYEVAMLAKKKGFDGGGCFKHYDQNGLLRSNRSFSRFDLTIDELYRHDTPSEVQVYAPTQSLLQRWLREEKGVTICVDIFDDGWFFDISTFYKQDTGVYEVDIPYKSSNVSPVYDTYELALEDALKYALENLV